MRSEEGIIHGFFSGRRWLFLMAQSKNKKKKKMSFFGQMLSVFLLPISLPVHPHRPYSSNKPVLTDKEGGLNGKEKRKKGFSLRVLEHVATAWNSSVIIITEFLSLLVLFSCIPSLNPLLPSLLSTVISAVPLRREGRGWAQERELTGKPAEMWGEERFVHGLYGERCRRKEKNWIKAKEERAQRKGQTRAESGYAVQKK